MNPTSLNTNCNLTFLILKATSVTNVTIMLHPIKLIMDSGGIKGEKMDPTVIQYVFSVSVLTSKQQGYLYKANSYDS